MLTDIPDRMEIAGEQLAEKVEETAFSGAQKVEVRFRKTVEYYLALPLLTRALKRRMTPGSGLLKS